MLPFTSRQVSALCIVKQLFVESSLLLEFFFSYLRGFIGTWKFFSYFFYPETFELFAHFRSHLEIINDILRAGS